VKISKMLPLFIVFVSSALAAPAVDSSPVETQLRPLLQNKIIGLLVPYTADDLKFDANSQLVGTSDIGPWTLFGSIQVSDVSVKDNTFQIEGERVILVLPHGKTTLMPMLSGRKVHVTIALTPPVDANSVRGALGDIFSSASVDEHFASYWKPTVDNLMDLDKPCKTVLKANPDGVVGTIASTSSAYGCAKGNAVTKPKGITTLAPGAGSKKPMEGSASLRLIIDEHGYPAIIYAKTSSNSNYGVAAIEAVSQWRYNPAMKDGKPVSYMLDVDLGKSVAAATDADSDKDKD
jgi:hypothetical protein